MPFSLVCFDWFMQISNASLFSIKYIYAAGNEFLFLFIWPGKKGFKLLVVFKKCNCNIINKVCYQTPMMFENIQF